MQELMNASSYRVCNGAYELIRTYTLIESGRTEKETLCDVVQFDERTYYVCYFLIKLELRKYV